MAEPDDLETQTWALPRIPASAGALIRDTQGAVLVVNPTYKPHWTIPGGQIEAAESPWEACRRETREECGLELTHARLACVDFLSRKGEREGGIRFLFDCGVFSDTELAAIVLQASELSEYRLASATEARELLSGPIGRRVAAALAAEHCVYLEDGRPLPAVRS